MSIFKSKLKTYEKSRKWSEGITWRSAHAYVSVCRGSFSCDPDSKGEVQNHHGLFPFQCHVQVVMFRLLQHPPVVGRKSLEMSTFAIPLVVLCRGTLLTSMPSTK